MFINSIVGISILSLSLLPSYQIQAKSGKKTISSTKQDSASIFKSIPELQYQNWWENREKERFRLPKPKPASQSTAQGGFAFETQITPPKSSQTPYVRTCDEKELSANQKDISSCLLAITQKNFQFNKILLEHLWNPGTSWACARYVADACAESGQTKSRPSGCRGSEKTRSILSQENDFIDLVPYFKTSVSDRLLGAEAHSPQVMEATKMVPPGTIMSFTGHNRNRKKPKRNCPGSAGMGHMTAKAIIQDTSSENIELYREKFCHFICDNCPALPNRYMDKLLIKIKPEFRTYFDNTSGNARSLREICSDVMNSKNAIPETKTGVN